MPTWSDQPDGLGDRDTAKLEERNLVPKRYCAWDVNWWMVSGQPFGRRVITGERGRDGAAYLNETPSVLMLDTFEELGALIHHLQDEFLPGLRRTVKVVISGRQPLGTAWSAWGPVVQSIVLSGFPPEESRTYLRVRGIGSDLEDEITAAAGGSPLALSLAADMATQLGVREFRAATESRLALRSLV